MKRVLQATLLLAPLALLAGCGDPTTALAVIGLLFLLGVIGSRGAVPADATPLADAQIHVQKGVGSAVLHLKETTRTDLPAQDVNVTGPVKSDGTFDLSGKLADGTALRVQGKNGDLITLTVGTKTTEHTSIKQD